MKKLTKRVLIIVSTSVLLFIIGMTGTHLYTNFHNTNLDLNKVISYQVNEYGITFQLDNGEEYYLEPMKE